jgi:hypothetical protein
VILSIHSLTKVGRTSTGCWTAARGNPSRRDSPTSPYMVTSSRDAREFSFYGKSSDCRSLSPQHPLLQLKMLSLIPHQQLNDIGPHGFSSRARAIEICPHPRTLTVKSDSQASCERIQFSVDRRVSTLDTRINFYRSTQSPPGRQDHLTQSRLTIDGGS